MRKFRESRGEVSPRQRDCKRNVHDAALVGGSARIPIAQRMIQEFFNGKEQRFTELVVLTSTRTETVLPMNWEGGNVHWRDVKEQTSVPSRSGKLLMKLLGIASITLDVESGTSTSLVQLWYRIWECLSGG